MPYTDPWCNGNTADFGSVIPSSSLGGSTSRAEISPAEFPLSSFPEPSVGCEQSGCRVANIFERAAEGSWLCAAVGRRMAGEPLSILCGCDTGDGGSFSCRTGLRVCRYGRGRSVGDRMFRCIAVADLVFRVAVQRLAATGCISGARFCGEFEAHTAGTEAVTG